MSKSLLILLACCITTLSGCAGCRNDIAARGGLVGSYTGDYIVISQSGGQIMDVWKLKNVYVQSETNSDGWRFLDDRGNSIFVGGDIKIIRVKEKGLFDKYHEYHMEHENQTYRDKHNIQRANQ